MYYYFYDSFLNDAKYQKALHKIENRLVDLDINGKIGRGSLLVNEKKIIEEEIKQGAHTIVAVGDDHTLGTIANVSFSKNITVGFIPLGRKSYLAKILGIPEGYLACDVLSQRRVKTIDVLEANGNICLSSITLKNVKSKAVKIKGEGKFELNFLSQRGDIYVFNLVEKEEIARRFSITQNIKKYFNPNDGLLDLVLNPTKNCFWKRMLNKGVKGVSILPLTFLEIELKDKAREKDKVKAYCDFKEIDLPLRIKIIPSALEVIVGKDRKF